MRTRCLIVAIVVLIGLSGCDWPQFRFGPSRTGASSDFSINKDTVGSLHLAWTASTGFPTGSPVPASPAVAGGVVYVPARDAVLHGYDAAGVKNCVAGPPATCTDVWTGLDAFGVGLSSPSVDGDLVYVGSGVGDVYVFDRKCNNCNYDWLGQVNGPIGTTSPVIADGVAYITSEADPSYLYAFDAAGPPGNCDQYDVCAPLWRGVISSGNPHTIAVGADVVYTGGRQVDAFAAGTVGCSSTPQPCPRLWTTGDIGQISSIAVTGGMVYAGAGNDTVSVFDAAGTQGCSGTTKVCQPLWTAPTGGPINSAVAVAGNVLYVGSSDGKLYAFDARGITGCSGGPPKHCDPLWTATTGGSVDSSPAIANGVLYVGSDDGKLYAFDAAGQQGCSAASKTCTPLWTGSTGGAVNSSPAIANGFIYVGSDDGKLYAFKKG